MNIQTNKFKKQKKLTIITKFDGENMDKTLAVVLMLITLLVGLGLGSVAFPIEKVIYQDKIVEVPGETIIKNVTDTKVVKTFDASLLIDPAIDDFFDELDDSDDLVCGRYEYDLSDVSVSKIYDAYSVEFDDEDYTISFKVKLDFDEDGERSCKKTFDVEAFYEEDEDVVISY